MSQVAEKTSSDSPFGERIEGIDVPVFNEREVRAAAGILFLVGIVGYVTALTTGNFGPIRGFAILFLFDMMIRLFISPRLSPTMALSRLIIRRQRPEWVGAKQKQLAWGLGMGVALTACLMMGWLALPAIYTLILCGLCMGLLFLETAFGICIGCELSRAISKEKPELCPGDTCSYNPKDRRTAHLG
jgi:hypothetical protein